MEHGVFVLINTTCDSSSYSYTRHHKLYTYTWLMLTNLHMLVWHVSCICMSNSRTLLHAAFSFRICVSTRCASHNSSAAIHNAVFIYSVV